MKKILAVLFAFGLITICSSCGSTANNPQVIENTTIVFWVSNGNVYHVGKDCISLSHSNNIESGTVAEAKSNGKTRLCKVCGKGYKDHSGNLALA